MQKVGYKIVSEVFNKVNHILKMSLKSAGSFKPERSKISKPDRS